MVRLKDWRAMTQQNRFLLLMFLFSGVLAAPMWFSLALRWPVHPDYHVHALVLRLFSGEWWSGEGYARWLTSANNGMGGMDFMFQPPVHNFIGALFQPIAAFDPWGFGRLIMVAQVLAFSAGVSAYYWLKEYFPHEQAQYGAFIYVALPYWIGSFYDSFAVSQMAGVMAMPVLLMMAKRMAVAPLKNVPFYAMAQALLICSHMPTAMMFSGVALANAVVVATRGRRVLVGGMTVLAAGLGIGLSARYWMVAYECKQYINYVTFVTGFFDYNRNFMRFFHGSGGWWMATLLMALAPCAYAVYEVWNRKPLEHNRLLVYFWALILTGSVFMMFPVSEFIWTAVPTLKNLQFPIRFLIATMPPVAFLLANWWPKLRNPNMYFVIALIYGTTHFQMSFNANFATQISQHYGDILRYTLLDEHAAMDTQWMIKAGIRDTRQMGPDIRDLPPYRVLDGEA